MGGLRRSGAALAALMLLASAPTPAGAGDTPAERYGDGTLDAFAEASVAVEALAGTWRSRISAASGEAERARLRAQALKEMAAAAEQAGLTVSDYNRIVAAARDDPELVETIMARRAGLE